jgi:molybdopterin molybdotransferase
MGLWALLLRALSHGGKMPSDHVVGFDDALAIVSAQAASLPAGEIESAPLLQSVGRVLAEAVGTERDQPPFDRSTRDGFAVHSARLVRGGSLRVIGRVAAGQKWSAEPMQPDSAIQIMTGAPMPEGADAVVMVEHVERDGDAIRILGDRRLGVGENVVRRGSEARAGAIVIPRGTAMEAAEIALAAACGCASLRVFRRPSVAIVATGDELVELDAIPEEQQIRNSNSYGLSALVAKAGGEAVRLPIAPDRREELESIVVQARASDLVLLSGGVSMGEYDLVEEVLLSMGAEFFFTGVKMQPGKPVVFGRLPEGNGFPARYFFGLPGNPVSTQVTFHCFVEPLLRAMAGAGYQGPRFVQATLAADVPGKAGLMRVLPAFLASDRVQPTVKLVGWQGSGDLAANARANCYAVLPPERERFSAGEVITILLR